MGGFSSKNGRINSTKKRVSSLDFMYGHDEEGIARMQEEHHLFKSVIGKCFQAPVHDTLKNGGARVLDVGCGTGTWLCDVASDYQKCQFFGVDISSAAMTTLKPANVTFIEADLLKGLPFDDNSFDFVYMGFLTLCFTSEQWEHSVFKELLRVLRPGGWLEIFDIESTFYNGGPITMKLINSIHRELESQNIDPFIFRRIPGFMLATNHFERINTDVQEAGMGTWNGNIGVVMLDLVLGDLKAAAKRQAALMKISEREYLSMVEKIPEESNLYKTYANHHRFWGQKT